MRLAPFFASSLALALAASTAAAVTEPNGLHVPIDSTPEIQLYTLFQQKGEAIDWQNDAHVTPSAFSPLCGFTATFVLNQAGSHFGLAWYNETGTKPLASQLHQIFPPNTPVGTMFTGTAIKNDPAYMGGLVGFALLGGETHYTNASYDTVCTACNPAGNWITALMYASTVTPNAYYICFEDGPTSAFGWNNDGDFNDDVFFLTGITCSGGGQPCDTGKPGICAAGVTQCAGSGTVCQQLSQPKTETCNGIDDNCDGKTDEGAICPAGEICDKGTCVKSCSGGEFKCTPDKVCTTDGYCVDPACATVTCPSGKVCVAGVCKGPCDGVTCPFPEVCRVGACVDPCAGITCTAGQVCEAGVCVSSCTCLPCTAGKACDAQSGLCLDPTCVGKMCGAGTHCVAGACVDDCAGAVCPTGEACKAGHCVPVMGSSTSSASSSGVGFGVGGSSQAGGTGGTASSGTHANGTGGDTFGSGGGSAGSKGKCGCRVPGERDGDSGGGELALAGLALAIAAARRRRSR